MKEKLKNIYIAEKMRGRSVSTIDDNLIPRLIKP